MSKWTKDAIEAPHTQRWMGGSAQPVAWHPEDGRKPGCDKCGYFYDSLGGCKCGHVPLGEAMAAAQPVADEGPRALVAEIGNQIHNIACEHQNDDDLSERLGELRSQLWSLAATLPAHPAAPAPVEAGLREVMELIRWAHDTLCEINPSNYDHDEVCRLNDASVEVILALAPLLGETHGKSAEWWAEHKTGPLRAQSAPVANGDPK